MVVVTLKRLLISLLLILFLTILVVACGLAIIGGSDWYLKFDIQNFFFWGIIALAVQIWIGASLLLHHRKILNSIKRLSAFEDLNSYNAEKSFREMGDCGKEIRNVLKKVNELSVMRAERISALNNLTALLSEGYSEPVVVTDINGGIFTLSEKLKSRLAKETGSTNVRNITDIRSDIKLPEVLVFIEKQRAAWTSDDAGRISCTPVFDKSNTVQFCIWEFETSILAEKLIELNQKKSRMQPSYNRFRNLINPLSRKRGKNISE